MITGIKSRRSRFLVLLIFVVTACTTGVAENGNEEAKKKEVLTPLEQKMQKRIDKLAFSEEEIDHVIAMIAQYADIDIIKSPDVTGTITATLTDVPVEEALTNILAAHGYGYIKSANMIRILPLKDIVEKPEKLESRIYRITYADVTQVEKTLMKFISPDGSLSAITGTSNIIVTDRESRIKAIDTLIAEIDRITPQILVEARIYDVTTRDKLDIGVQWAAGRRMNTTFSHSSDLGTNPTSGPRNPFLTSGFEGAQAGKTAEATIGALRFGWLNSGIDVDVLLRAEQESIDAKLLANPRILVLDNEVALFDIVTEHPYVERTITAEAVTETIKFKLVGVKLQVTPHVTREGVVRLHIVPEFGVVVQEASAETSNVPVVDTRKVNTIALVKDGQTVVLGGLRKKDVSKQVNKIPLLGDLPLIGGLFRFEGEDTSITELLVFITPRIIETPVLSETEQRAYEATQFDGPEPSPTRAEKAIEKANK